VSLAHSPRSLPDPEGWVLYLAHRQPLRLIVFVHGFGGGAVSTWQRFPLTTHPWWCDSDLLFVDYDSRRDNITGTAARLRRHLPTFYPTIPDSLLEIEGARVRVPDQKGYEELFLIGHSLGGVVLRRTLCDVAHDWIMRRKEQADAEQPVILSAQLRLFSPASAGFRPAGALGVMRASPVWLGVNLHLRRSSAYTDLLPGSQILLETRRRTEELVSVHTRDLHALQASILWANPDDVVITERYDTDPIDDAADGTSHRSVCKPHDRYTAPWQMVESGVQR
jgi:pimeloyl-ACP methyl ester carboxylesterase